MGAVQHAYELTAVDDETWIIRDRVHGPRDPEHHVAALHQGEDDEIEVLWTRPTPLPVRYSSPQAVLEDLIRWSRRPFGGRRPVPIPAFRPR